MKYDFFSCLNAKLTSCVIANIVVSIWDDERDKIEFQFLLHSNS